ncbi:MAG: glycosyl transferase [Geobacteraceae bacterium GWC2_55_20]|nr:MAG: glycosyl transferase [Geobacteraceae bacterium GWC2_55_20]
MSRVPSVSILMPVRNEERYLQAALDSLYRQTLDDWELVAVDDGSSDSTPRILASAAASDSRIKMIRRDGGGLVAALNTGLVACSFKHFPRTSLKQGMVDYETWQNSLQNHTLISKDLFVESPFVHPGVMCRRSILEQLGGYRDHGWAEDYDLWLRMAAANVHFARLPGRFFFWRDHPERATRTMDEYSSNAFRSCKMHYLRQGFLKGCSEVVMAGAGIEARAWQRLLAANGISVCHWLDVDPRKIGRTLHGAQVTRPEELDLSGRKMLAAIGVRGARQQFRELANQLGWQEGMDFVCVA